MTTSTFLVPAVVGALFLFIGIVINNFVTKRNANSKRNRIIKEAEEKAEVLKKERILQAKEKFLQLKTEHESKINEKNSSIQRTENKLKQRETSLNTRFDEVQRKQSELNNLKQVIDKKQESFSKKEEELDRAVQIQRQQLETLSNLSEEEAKNQLIESMRDEATSEAASLIVDIIDEAKLTANMEAKKIVIEAIQRTAVEHAIENTVSVFNIENDEVKGRIIGREGRNIRALESLTGVEIIIDDSPDAIILSSFDPIRREVARLALHKLVTDGRIHPARIEEVVSKTKNQIEQEVLETGKRTCIDLGIHAVHGELMRMIGKMKYRSSYGQNLLSHSMEVSKLAGMLAAELGLNVKKAKRAGLLHDIGKVPDTESDLPHAVLGAKTAEKFKEKPDVCNAIGAHHDEMEMTNLISPLVQVADAISGARPGARREVVESYIQRLNKLEDLALEHPGVVKTFAIQAGRELRVIVGAEQVSDTEIAQISMELSKKIQEEMTYPGQIKITVIRETRSISYAK